MSCQNSSGLQVEAPTHNLGKYGELVKLCQHSITMRDSAAVTMYRPQAIQCAQTKVIATKLASFSVLKFIGCSYTTLLSLQLAN